MKPSTELAIRVENTDCNCFKICNSQHPSWFLPRGFRWLFNTMCIKEYRQKPFCVEQDHETCIRPVMIQLATFVAYKIASLLPIVQVLFVQDWCNLLNFLKLGYFVWMCAHWNMSVVVTDWCRLTIFIRPMPRPKIIDGTLKCQVLFSVDTDFLSRHSMLTDNPWYVNVDYTYCTSNRFKKFSYIFINAHKICRYWMFA